MTNTSFRLSTSLSLLALLAACSGGEFEEGSYGIIRAGHLSSLGDSEASWTIYAHKPLKFDMWLIGSKGRIGGESSFAQSEGPCVYHIRFSQEEVEGSDFLKDVGVLGGEEASAAVKAAVPSIEGHSAFRYSLELASIVTEMERDDLKSMHLEIDAYTATKMTSTSSSSGWVPGSIFRGEGEGGMRACSMHGMEETLQPFTLGEPLFLASCVELPGGGGGFISTRESGDDFMIRYSYGSQEVREVSLSEYEGRAWALKLTLTEAE